MVVREAKKGILSEPLPLARGLNLYSRTAQGPGFESVRLQEECPRRTMENTRQPFIFAAEIWLSIELFEFLRGYKFVLVFLEKTLFLNSRLCDLDRVPCVKVKRIQCIIQFS